MLHYKLSDVTKLPRIDKKSVLLSHTGSSIAMVGTLAHLPALVSHYGSECDVPDPLCSVEDNETLCIWWECGGWPLVIRIDAEDWNCKQETEN